MPHLMYLLFKHQFCFPLKESTPRPKGQPMLQSSHIPSPKIKISETQLSTSHIIQSSMPLRNFQSRCSKHQQRPPKYGGRNTLLRYNRAWRKLPWERVGPRLKEMLDVISSPSKYRSTSSALPLLMTI